MPCPSYCGGAAAGGPRSGRTSEPSLGIDSAPARERSPAVIAIERDIHDIARVFEAARRADPAFEAAWQDEMTLRRGLRNRSCAALRRRVGWPMVGPRRRPPISCGRRPPPGPTRPCSSSEAGRRSASSSCSAEWFAPPSSADQRRADRGPRARLRDFARAGSLGARVSRCLTARVIGRELLIGRQELLRQDLARHRPVSSWPSEPNPMVSWPTALAWRWRSGSGPPRSRSPAATAVSLAANTARRANPTRSPPGCARSSLPRPEAPGPGISLRQWRPRRTGRPGHAPRRRAPGVR